MSAQPKHQKRGQLKHPIKLGGNSSCSESDAAHQNLEFVLLTSRCFKQEAAPILFSLTLLSNVRHRHRQCRLRRHLPGGAAH